MIQQAGKLLETLHSSGRLKQGEYDLLRDTLNGLEADRKRYRDRIGLILDKFRTERKNLEQTVIRYDCAIEDIESEVASWK